MTFAEYFVLLQRRWRVWVTGLVLGLVAAGVVSALAPTRYTATSLSFVVGLAMLAYYFFKYEHYVGFDRVLWRPQWTQYRRIAEVGLPA